MLPQQDEDPFGTYEYIEPADRCAGAEDHCPLRGQCTGRLSTCQCHCPYCLDDELYTTDTEWPPVPSTITLP